MSTDLSVIIVNWNTCELLQQCLTSLFQYTMNIRYEVFVVDNGSSDESSRMVTEHFPDVRLIQNQENVGFSKANNQAIRLTSGQYILLLNSDTALRNNACAKIVHFMNMHGTVGMAGTKLLNPDGTRQYSCDYFPRTPFAMIQDKICDLLPFSNWRNWRTRQKRWNFDENFAIDYIIGAALLIRRETMNQIGLLDEQFFMYAEDIDWCYRAALAGWQTYYLGTIAIYHHNRGSSEKTLTQSVALNTLRTDSLQRFYKKHYGIWNAFLFLMNIRCKRLFQTFQTAL